MGNVFHLKDFVSLSIVISKSSKILNFNLFNMSLSADIITISNVLGDGSVGVSASVEHNASNGIPEHSGPNGFGDMLGTNDVKFAVSSVLSLNQTEENRNRIPMVNRVLWEPEKRVKVISIGCGFSGLTLAQKIQHKYKLDHIIEHVIYEKNTEIGGTWFEVS
jgi:hypothetical protein